MEKKKLKTSVARGKMVAPGYTPASPNKPAKTSAKSTRLNQQREITVSNARQANLKTPTSVHSSFTRPAQTSTSRVANLKTPASIHSSFTKPTTQKTTVSTARQSNLKTPASVHSSFARPGASLAKARSVVNAGKTGTQPTPLTTGRNKVSTVKATATAKSKKRY